MALVAFATGAFAQTVVDLSVYSTTRPAGEFETDTGTVVPGSPSFNQYSVNGIEGLRENDGKPVGVGRTGWIPVQNGHPISAWQFLRGPEMVDGVHVPGSPEQGNEWCDTYRIDSNVPFTTDVIREWYGITVDGQQIYHVSRFRDDFTSHAFAISSLGPDGVPFTADDVENWSDPETDSVRVFGTISSSVFANPFSQRPGESKQDALNRTIWWFYTHNVVVQGGVDVTIDGKLYSIATQHPVTFDPSNYAKVVPNRETRSFDATVYRSAPWVRVVFQLSPSMAPNSWTNGTEVVGSFQRFFWSSDLKQGFARLCIEPADGLKSLAPTLLEKQKKGDTPSFGVNWGD